MAAKNTDFLKFNAYAIKDLIVRKLTENSDFTDQLYEGSNLNILIDIFSYICQTLLFSLNTAAAESMFADTQLYENINRLCAFLGYNPKGLYPSIARFSVAPSTSEITIPEYSYVNIGSTDMHGNVITYSTREQIKIGPTDNHEIQLINGRWKLYNKVFYSTGENWQTIILDQLCSDFDNNKFVADYYMDVYVINYEENGNTTNVKTVYKYRPTSQQLFKPIYATDVVGQSDLDVLNGNSFDSSVKDNRNTIYSGILTVLKDNKNSTTHTRNEAQIKNDCVFNLRLNENKQYVITFGDGTTGAKPPAGSSIYIVYLDTNGLDGLVVPNTSVGNFNNDRILAKLGCAYENFDTYVAQATNIQVTSISSNSPARLEESVDSIRENAPAWFRMGNRLVTKEDYEYYLRTSPLMSEFIDIKCQNNWEYITTFYRWLYELGVKYHSSTDDGTEPLAGRYYLNQNNIYISGKRIADPADGNNIYIWCLPHDGNSDFIDSAFDKIKTNIKPIKDMTHDLVLMNAIPVFFQISAAPDEVIKQLINENKKSGSLMTGLNDNFSYLEITVDDNIMFNNANIANEVYLKLMKYFIRNQKLGQNLNFNDLLTDIYDIHGILNIRTVYLPKVLNVEYPSMAVVRNGISFVTFTNNECVQFDDYEVSNSGRSLEVFQYPYFNFDAQSIGSKIRVIKKSLANINVIGY